MPDIQINHLTGDMGVTEKIKKAMFEAAKQFVYIGFLLWETKEYHYYAELNYHDVYDYAENELGLKRTSTKNFINICCTFCSKSIDSHTGRPYFSEMNMHINPEYSKFSYSQLTEMLAMSAHQREQITPEMTIKEIRAIKEKPINFKALDKIIAAGQTSDRPIIESDHPVFDDIIVPTGPGHQEACKDRPDLHSVVINNHWCDISEDLLLKLIRASGLKKSKNLCYNIKIEVHKEN